ncbi:MAG: hypothetical protein HWE10_07420 [Gammaproteobacteria bacterium]|nr:hypothetical protein [Gammaproteobacteria bacterium]
MLVTLCLNLAANESTPQKVFTLSKELKIFEPYLGKWQAEFPPSASGEKVTDVSEWHRALNGKAVRTLHSINNGAYGGESLIFWDKNKQQIVFYYFTTADFMTTGYIEVLADNRFAAYEDVSGESSVSQGISKVRSVSTLSSDAITVETSYLKNGEWTAPQRRVYHPTQNDVIFK